MDTKEMIGYISRWCLLAMSVMLAMASSAIIFRAMATMREDPERSVVVSDAIWCKAGNFAMSLYGSVQPDPSGWDMDRLLARNPDLSLSLVAFSARHIYLTAPQPPKGLGRVEILSIPYSSAAFEKWSLQLLVPRGHETIYMIDAYMAAVSDPAATTEMLGLLTDLKRRGIVIFICAEQGEDFVDLRQAVDRLDPEAMLICTDRRPSEPLKTTTSLPQHYLDMSGLENMRGRLVVVTDDPNCAMQVTSVRIQTYLVHARQDESIRSSDYLTRRETIAKLREYINWLPTD